MLSFPEGGGTCGGVASAGASLLDFTRPGNSSWSGNTRPSEVERLIRSRTYLVIVLGSLSFREGLHSAGSDRIVRKDPAAFCPKNLRQTPAGWTSEATIESDRRSPASGKMHPQVLPGPEACLFLSEAAVS